jgi:hypothetical protein
MVDLAEYRRMKKQVERDMADLVQERNAMEERRNQIDHQIDSLEKLSAHLDTCLDHAKSNKASDSHAYLWREHKPQIQPEMGIIKAVRAVLHGAHRKRLQPPDVRDILLESGFQNSKNFLPEIHAALRRLASRGELTAIKFGKRTAYRSRGMRGMRMRNSAQ